MSKLCAIKNKTNMQTFTIYNPNMKPDEAEKEKIVNFLFEHLDEYGDPKKDIRNSLDFAVHDVIPSLGGFVLLLKEKGEILGATIVNKTGMSGYIPENILVYIAVDGKKRGQGIGKKIMNKALEMTEGSVALHVEPDNPAKYLYEKTGFTSKYLEMRYTKG